jgi:O-antigen/teichoic acid export membrane protein
MILRQHIYKAVRATAVSHGTRFALLILQISILARLLQPDDFGLMAVLAALLSILGILADFGISRALIHFREISDQARNSLFWFTILLSIGLAAAMILAAPVISLIFGSPVLSPVLMLGGLIFPLSAIGQQFRVIAEKNLRFTPLTRIEMFSTLTGIITSIGFALADFGVYSLVLGTLVSTAVNSGLACYFLSSGWRPKLSMRMVEIQPFMAFGRYLIGESLANTLRMEMDIFICGMMADSAAVGMYSLARNLSLKLSTTVINPVVTRVGLPTLADAQHDTFKLKKIYLAMLHMVSSINFPLYVILGLFSHDIVFLLYGPDWGPTANYLTILAAWGLIRSIGNPVGSLIIATGRARRAFWWNICLLVVTPLLLAVGMYANGIIGLTCTLVLSQLLIFLLAWRLLVFSICGASFMEYCSQLIAPLGISILAGACAFPVLHLLPQPLLRLAVGTTIFITAYLGLSMVFNRSWFNTMREVLLPKFHKT